MPNDRHPNLPKTIADLYRAHWRLFWCIMLPVTIVAISLNIALFLPFTAHFEYLDAQSAESPSRSRIPSRPGTLVSSDIDTIIAPNFRVTDDEGVTWEWNLKFLSFHNSALVLLLLAVCPLSLAVARISRSSQGAHVSENLPPPTTLEMWRQTGRKALTVFAASLLFLLIADVGTYCVLLIDWLIPSISWRSDLAFELRYILVLVPHVYFVVTLSLYNPCLILEDNSLFGTFRRSHALVSSARLRFLGIYLLTGWIVAVIASVLVGLTLFVLSMFVPELAGVREALASLKFLTLFIGADMVVALPQILGVSTQVAILILKGLIATFLVPIWAIVTTLLYLERVDTAKGTV